MSPRLTLCDTAPAMIDAWTAYFAPFPDIDILCDTPAALDADALIVPTTTFGRMDGGLPQDVLDLFGEEPQRELQSTIAHSHDGELLIGDCEIILAPACQFPILVCCPVMRVPQNLSRTVNAYLSLRAALLSVRAFNQSHGDIITTLIAPALAATNGLMPPLRAARQMRAAYDTVMFNTPPNEDISLDAGVDGDDKYAVRPSEAAPPAYDR